MYESSMELELRSWPMPPNCDENISAVDVSHHDDLL